MRKVDRQTGRLTRGRDIVRQGDRQTDRQTGRQIDKRKRYSQTGKQKVVSISYTVGSDTQTIVHNEHTYVQVL